VDWERQGEVSALWWCWADRVAHALANQDVGAKLSSLSTVESDVQLGAAERKIGRGLEQLSAMAGAQVSC